MHLCLHSAAARAVLLIVAIAVTAESRSFAQQATHPVEEWQGSDSPEGFCGACAECCEYTDGFVGTLLTLLQGGGVELADVSAYPRIPDLDCDDPDALLYTWRPNLIGQDVPDEWDFSNLVNTDRPDFTDATFSAGKDVVIIETGYTYRKINTADTNFNVRTVPEITIRSGITNELELRLKWLGYAMIDQRDLATGMEYVQFGAQDLSQLGFKYEVRQQDGWAPMVTFVGTTSIPNGQRGLSANTIQPAANLVLGWGVRRWLYLKTSTGYDALRKQGFVVQDQGGGTVPTFGSARDSVNEFHYSISLLSQLSKRVGAYHEYYTLFRDGASDSRPDHFLNTGLFLYCTTNVQLDVRAGTRLSDRIDEQFYGAGFSVRY